MKKLVFKFSVIMPVYNVELFLHEAVESILMQTIGFIRNVQLILIDDGSTDSSGEICDVYANRFPHNIRVIHQEHAGAETARNIGLNEVRGKYVTFLDSDDRLSENALGEVYKCLEINKEQIDFAAIPIVYFDGKDKKHDLNYRFKGRRTIVDVSEEFAYVQPYICASFFKFDAISSMRFSTKISGENDIGFLLDLLMNNSKYGLVKNATYYFRIRVSGNPALLQTISSEKEFYLKWMHEYVFPLVKRMQNPVGTIPQYAQFMILMEMNQRFSKKDTLLQGILTEDEINEFKKLFSDLLGYIDDDVILALPEEPYVEGKIFFLEKKHHQKAELRKKMLFDVCDSNSRLALIDSKKSISDFISNEFQQEILGRLSYNQFIDGQQHIEEVDKDYLKIEVPKIYKREDMELWFNGKYIFDLSKLKTVLEFLRIKDDCLYLEGYTTFLGIKETKGLQVYLVINDAEYIECDLVVERNITKKFWGEAILPAVTFSGKVRDISKYNKFDCKIAMAVNAVHVEKTNLNMGEFFPLESSLQNSYVVIEEWMIKHESNRLLFSKAETSEIIFQEEKLLSEIAGRKDAESMKAIRHRRIYHELKPLCKKEIWMMRDRINKSGDNAEILFRYMNSTPKEEETYFSIMKDCADFNVVSEFGNTLEHLSDSHLISHLLSDKIVSSHFSPEVRCPFENLRYYKDILYHKKIVYLQHGVLMDDHAEVINRYKKNFDLMTTSAIPEYKSLLEKKYFYNDNVIKLTGMARYDALEDHNEKKIIIAPTWRKWLTTWGDFRRTGNRSIVSEFKESSFFKFYEKLLNDADLLDYASARGYRVCFMPHPHMVPVIHEFSQANGVTFLSGDTRYNDVFSKGSLLVTDYSSVFFDFAYLRKPVIYCHFDVEEFLNRHTSYSQGYYDYERDGFGEVTYNLEDTIQKIKEYIDNECKLKPKYEERITSFFAYHDRNNSERIYREIHNIEGASAKDGAIEKLRRQEKGFDVFLRKMQSEWIDPRSGVSEMQVPYVFPIHLVEKKERVVLYGLGRVGRTFYWQNWQYGFCNIIACIDKNLDISSVKDFMPMIELDELDSLAYDSILIAVLDEAIAMKIKERLLALGVSERSIKWDGENYRGEFLS